MSSSKLAQFERVHAALSTDVGFRLLPHNRRKIFRYARLLHECVADVDEELERNRKLVFHHAGRDEDALRVADVVVAMANRAVAQFGVVALRDAGLVAFADRERHEVIRLALQGGGDRRRHGSDYALQVLARDGVLAKHRVADAVGRLGHFGRAHNIRCRTSFHVGGLGHCADFNRPLEAWSRAPSPGCWVCFVIPNAWFWRRNPYRLPRAPVLLGNRDSSLLLTRTARVSIRSERQQQSNTRPRAAGSTFASSHLLLFSA